MTAVAEVGEAADRPPPTGRARAREVWVQVRKRPVLVTALLGTLYVVLQCTWIVKERHLGAFDVDEAAGISTALHFHRALFDGPKALWDSVFGTGNGPLVPLMSIPFLILFGRSATTAIFVQPFLVAVAACAAAGAVNRIAGRSAAIVAGVGVLGMPVLIVSARSDQYSQGVGTFLALALWALLASDRGRKSWQMLGFGAATGAMLLCRTMSAGFLPSVAIAALLVVALRERRVILNLAGSALAAVAVAGPWWYAEWDYVTGYLNQYAYGDRAGIYGPTSVSGRVHEHVTLLLQDFRVLVLILPATAALTLLAALHWRRSGRRWREWPVVNRGVAAAWVLVVGGFAALLSTPNAGFWFATPLDVALVVAVVGVLARLPGKLPQRRAIIVLALFGFEVVTLALIPGNDAVQKFTVGLTFTALVVLACTRMRWQRSLSILGCTTTAVVLLLSVPAIRSDRHLVGKAPIAASLVGSLDDVHAGNIEADPRLGSSKQGVRRRAADQWAAATNAVVEQLSKLDRHGPFVETVTGSMHLFNSTTLSLAEELYPRAPLSLQVPNTLEPPDRELRKSVSPTVNGAPRVLVVIEGRSQAFPNDLGRARLVRLARASGWIQGDPIRLPDGGNVSIYTNPASMPPPP